VHTTSHVRGGDQWPGGSRRDREVGRRAGRVEHLERVDHDLVDTDVAGHAGNRQHPERGMAHREQQRQAVVHSGVDVEDHVHDAEASAPRPLRREPSSANKGGWRRS
jgi:hypothetical protein